MIQSCSKTNNWMISTFQFQLQSFLFQHPPFDFKYATIMISITNNRMISTRAKVSIQFEIKNSKELKFETATMKSGYQFC